MNGSEMEVKDRNTMSLVELFCRWKSACQKFLSKTGRYHVQRKGNKVVSGQVAAFAACPADMIVTTAYEVQHVTSQYTDFSRRLTVTYTTLYRQTHDCEGYWRFPLI